MSIIRDVIVTDRAADSKIFELDRHFESYCHGRFEFEYNYWSSRGPIVRSVEICTLTLLIRINGLILRSPKCFVHVVCKSGFRWRRGFFKSSTLMSDNATWDAIWPRESLVPYLMAASVAVKAELHCAEKEVWYVIVHKRYLLLCRKSSSCELQ